jgi:hypothetical protein
MNKDVMNQGVQILLDRMDTNPEEFEEGSYSKWGDIVQAVHARVSSPEAHKKNAPLPFLSDAEVKAMYDKLEDVRRENFTADVLRRLANVANLDVQEDLFDSRSYTMGTGNVPLGGGALTSTTGAVGTWGKSSVTLAEVQALTEEQKQDILDLIEAQNKRKKKATAR